MARIQEIIEEFQGLDFNTTLEMLLDYANSLPELPEEYKEARDAGLNRVHECQTPVFMWVNVKDGRVSMHADVARESPTVRGFVSILVDAFDGATPDEVEQAPSNLLTEIGLVNKLGMTRTRGLGAVYGRLKNDVRKAASPAY
ncbi:MAG: SufE family protein [Candidatus Dadabacteria bacterium]|nr:SufE family protein [Candidatus Dadabacteria bacterium]